MIRTLFYTLNAANKGAGRPDVPKMEINKIGILGAGMMGAGIAYVSARAGLDVVLKDVTLEGAEKGKAYSEKLLSKKLSRGWMSQEALLADVAAPWEADPPLLPMFVLYRDSKEPNQSWDMVGSCFLSTLWTVRVGPGMGASELP